MSRGFDKCFPPTSRDYEEPMPAYAMVKTILPIQRRKQTARLWQIRLTATESFVVLRDSTRGAKGLGITEQQRWCPISAFDGVKEKSVLGQGKNSSL